MIDRDKVRLLIGDTDTDPDADAVLSDAEIDDLLVGHTILNSSGGTLGVNHVAAAADAAGACAAKFSRSMDFMEDGQSFRPSQRVTQYLALEARLRKRQGPSSVPLTLAGTVTAT